MLILQFISVDHYLILILDFNQQNYSQFNKQHYQTQKLERNIIMNLFEKIIMQKHNCLKSHICTHNKCPNSYSFICDNLTSHDSHKNHPQCLLTREQFLIKIEQHKQYSKFENRLVVYTIKECIRKMGIINSLKASVCEKENNIISNLSRIQSCFNSSIRFQKILSSNLFNAESNSNVFQMLKQNLQFNPKTKCFIDACKKQGIQNQQQKFATISDIQQFSNANKCLIQEMLDLYRKMFEQIEQQRTLELPQQSFQANEDDIQLWESQQKCYKTINNHLEQYSKDFRKQLEGRFDILRKTKKAVSEFNSKNQANYEGIEHLVETPPQIESPLKKKMKILSSFSMQKQRQSFLTDISTGTSCQSKALSLFESPKLNRLELISGNQYEQMNIMLQLQKNQIEQQLAALKNELQKAHKKGMLETGNRVLQARFESLMKQTRDLKEEINRIRNDNHGVRQQINQQICNYVEQYYQDHIIKNNSIIGYLQITLNCKSQDIVREVVRLKQSLPSAPNIQRSVSQPGQNLAQKIKEMQKYVQEKNKQNNQLQERLHKARNQFSQSNGKNPQDRQSYQLLVHQSQKRLKQNQSLIERLKQLQLTIQDRDKQIINLQRLKISNNVTKEYDQQLRINKQYYQNQVFLAHQENQKLSTKIKYLKNKIDNLNSFYSIQSQKIFEAQSKGSYLQSQLQEAAWQKYVLIDKNNALQKESRLLKKNIEKFKDKFYVLKDYATKLQNTQKQHMITSVIDQRIDLDHFDVQYSICDSPLRNQNQLRVSNRAELISPNMDNLSKISENMSQLEESKPLDSFLKIEPVKLLGSDVILSMNQEQQINQKISVPPLLLNNIQSREYENDRPKSLKNIQLREKRFEKKPSFGQDLQQDKIKFKRANTQRNINQKKIKCSNNYTININEPNSRKQKKLNRNQSYDSFQHQFPKQHHQNKAKGLMFINQLLKKDKKNEQINLSSSFRMK